MVCLRNHEGSKPWKFNDLKQDNYQTRKDEEGKVETLDEKCGQVNLTKDGF